jgi:hypothetical protein
VAIAQRADATSLTGQLRVLANDRSAEFQLHRECTTVRLRWHKQAS